MNDRKRIACARRDFLKIAGAIGAGLFVVPALDRVALADLRPGAPARRVLIINFVGAMRSSAAFLASNEVRYNPWGLIQGAPIPFGAVLDDTSPPLALSSAWGGAHAPRVRDLF